MTDRISGHTRLLALLGSPVGHSGSPAMYNYSFEKLGLDYVYVAFDVKEDQVPDALKAMRTVNMRGCNAVNTIVNENGKLVGYITDGEGFNNNLREHGVEVKDQKVTIVGGGGAATAIQVQ